MWGQNKYIQAFHNGISAIAMQITLLLLLLLLGF